MMNQNKHYQQLTQAQRYQIYAFRKAGLSLRAIGAEIGVHFSTVSRELKRNQGSDGYQPEHAQCLSDTRKSQAAKASKRTHQLDSLIRKRLTIGWSPESISQRLKIECNPSEHVCHTTIYRWIAEDHRNGGFLYKLLPRHGKTRWKGGKRKVQAGVRLIPDRIDISERPKLVEDRSRRGDWEGDTIHGKNAHLVTLVDRLSRFTLAKIVRHKDKETVASAMLDLLSEVDHVKTITLDNGGEFAAHSLVSEKTGAEIYFAKPYASWQRGTNENINGRIRRLWPKKFDMASLSKVEVENEILLLNFTPRKVLGGLTPWEAFNSKRVALIT